MIVDRVLQDALEQHRQLGGRFISIFLGQLEHGVLDDVERRVVVAHGEHRLLERAPLDFCEERRYFLVRGQLRGSEWGNQEFRAIIGGMIEAE